MTTALIAPDLHVEPHSDLYPAGMVKRVLRGVQEMRLYLGAIFDSIEKQGEHVVLTRRGKPIAVLVPIRWYREAAKAMDDPTEF